jgi:hypothetical protein
MRGVIEHQDRVRARWPTWAISPAVVYASCLRLGLARAYWKTGLTLVSGINVTSCWAMPLNAWAG